MYALAEQRIFCFEKTVVKLGIIIILLTVFSGDNISLKAQESSLLLKGFVQENTMLKEHDDALFLLQQRNMWVSQLKTKYGKNIVEKIVDGVAFVRINKNFNFRKIRVNVVEIKKSLNSKIEILPLMASTKMHSKSGINKIASNKEVKVAINGTYFKQNTGTPLGTLVIDNKLISGPMYDRVAFGIAKDGFKVDRIAFNGSIKKKNIEIKIDNINQPRTLFSQVLIYTSSWGIKSPENKSKTRQLAIYNDKIIAISDYPLIIPENGYVLSSPIEKVKDFKLGDKVKVNYSLSPAWEDVKHIISGGPYLLKNGEIFVDAKEQKLGAITGLNPRTAIGYTKDNTLIMVVVEGRKEGSSGVTLVELAKIMQKLGCYEAINLDGGSSSVMYVDGKVYSGCSGSGNTQISNVLAVKMGE